MPVRNSQAGEAALAEGRYGDALAAFEAAGDYEDAAERRTASLSGAIEACLTAGELEKAERKIVFLEEAEKQNG